MNRLRIGLVGLTHSNFPGDKEGIYSEVCSGFTKLAEELDFQPLIIPQGVIAENGAWQAYHRFKEAGLDFLLILNVQFALGKIISILADLPVKLGLWSLPEPALAGPLPGNSFCGMNMNASILHEYLGIKKYKWFYGNVTDPKFRERFSITVNALKALKKLQGSRMAIIGGIADGFDCQYYDEREIYRKFQVKIIRNLEFDDVYDRMKSYNLQDIKDIKEKMVANLGSISEIAGTRLEATARLIKTISDFQAELGLSAVTLNCWPKFRQKLDMVACAAIGFLNYFNVLTTCEGDVYGMLSMYILRQLSSYPSLLMDLVDFSEADGSVLLWHCGVGTKDLAYRGELGLTAHSNPAYIAGGGLKQHAPVANMIYRKGKGTVLRITHDGKALFVLSGEFNHPEKPSFDGSRGWLSSLELNGQSINVPDLVNTIMMNGMQHHYAVALGNYTRELLEIGSWLGLSPLQKISYTDYLQCD
jgi:L-fucose isomerase-like protein